MAAINALRLRRTLSVFHRALSSAHPTAAIYSPSSFSSPSASDFIQSPISKWHFNSPAQCLPFRSSVALFSSARSSFDNEKIDPDTILFEGCDYNHWLITMDFPKDPKPTPEEMVRTYEETCAKGLGISIEEAKRRMYACSTTTYQGFQALMTEEESEKFRGLPGVVFILPDSYIDPVNKEYGGDKYENGVITPRPPPFKYRRDGGRFQDRNRNPDQPRYDRQGGQVPSQQGNPQYVQQGHMQGDGRNFLPSQNYPQQQNFGERAPRGYPTQQNYGPAGSSQNYPPQKSYGPPGTSQNYPQQQNFGPPGASQRFSPQQSYGPPGGGRDAYQTDRRDSMSPPQGNYNTGMHGNYQTQERRGFSQADRRDYAPSGQGYSGMDPRNYSPSHGGSAAQGNTGSYGQGMNGSYGQGASGYGQNYPGEAQRSPQMEQSNVQGQQTNYVPPGGYRN